MKTTLLFASLTALLTAGFTYAQQTTFDFTAGTLSGSGTAQRWSQTVDGITCTVVFNDDTDADYGDAGSPALIDADGLYAGKTTYDLADRTAYREYGVSITFRCMQRHPRELRREAPPSL